MAYCTPQEDGLQSEARAVGRRIGKMLDALATINAWVIEDGEGTIVDESCGTRKAIIRKLEAEGWRISIDVRDRYRVLPPVRTQGAPND